jgi:PST family polysaccharide transporter
MLATIAPFSLLGMDLAITRYTAIAEERASRESYLLTGLLLAISPGLVILLIGLLFRDSLSFLIFQNRAYTSLFIATLVLVVSYSFYVVLYAHYRGMARMNRANMWQLAVIGVAPVIIAWELSQSGNVSLIVLLLAISFFLASLPLGYYVRKILLQGPIPQLKSSARELLSYGVPRIPAGLALAALLTLGPFLAPHVGTLEDAGYLAAGQFVLLVMEGGVVAFGLVALPKVAQLAAEGQREFLRESISDIIAFFLHLGVFATLHILLWADEVVLILLGPQYEKAIPLMRIILLALVPYLAYVLLRSVVDAVEKKAINTLNVVLSFAVALISAMTLVALGLSVKGLALATTIGFVTLGFLTLRYIWTTFQIRSNSIELKRPLLFNVSLIMIALLFKYLLINRFFGPTWIGIVIIELALFTSFILLLWKIRVRWLLELEKRLIRKPANV